MCEVHIPDYHRVIPRCTGKPNEDPELYCQEKNLKITC